MRKLLEAGLWHEAGHDCDRCPQPADGYMIHDFFEGGRNVTKTQHEANRKGAAERAAKSRESKKRADSERESNNIQYATSFQMKPNRARNEPYFQGSTAGQEGLSHRTPADGAALAHAAAMPVPSTSSGSTAAAGEPAAAACPINSPPQARHRRRRLSGVSWDLRESAWEYTRQAIDRVGVPAMVAFAVNSARLKGLPAGASAWVQGWRSLEPTPEPQIGVSYLPAAVGLPTAVNRQQQEVDDWASRAMSRARARMTEENP
ncbi:hypothetical protein ACFQ2B_27685 [Streptomyces stramineus]